VTDTAQPVSVRELVNSIKREILAGDLTPRRMSDLELTLSALLGNIQDEIRNADALYADVLLKCMREESKANRARILAETSPEYLRKRAASDCYKLAVELIRSLRSVGRQQVEEMRLAR
jgi:hydrogenase maturation factor